MSRLLSPPGILSYPGVSRRFVDGNTTDGVRTRATSLVYCDVAAISIAMWVKRTGTAAINRRSLIDGGDNGSRGWSSGVLATGRVRFQSTCATADKLNSTNDPITQDRWTHLVMRDTALASLSAATIDFMIDGVVDTPTGTDGVGAHNTGTALNLSIGNTNGAAGGSPADIAHVAVWRLAVANSVGKQLAQGADPRDFRYGLIGYWKLNGESGHGFEPDLSGMGLPLFPFSATYAPRWAPAPSKAPYLPRRSRSLKSASAVGGIVPTDRQHGALHQNFMAT